MVSILDMVEPRCSQIWRMSTDTLDTLEKNAMLQFLGSSQMKGFTTEVKKKYSVMKESEALEFHHPKAFAYLWGDYFTLFFPCNRIL